MNRFVPDTPDATHRTVAFNIRNMPEELRRDLKIKAAEAGVSMEKYALALIEQGIKKPIDTL